VKLDARHFAHWDCNVAKGSFETDLIKLIQLTSHTLCISDSQKHDTFAASLIQHRIRDRGRIVLQHHGIQRSTVHVKANGLAFDFREQSIIDKHGGFAVIHLDIHVQLYRRCPFGIFESNLDFGNHILFVWRNRRLEQRPIYQSIKISLSQNHLIRSVLRNGSRSKPEYKQCSSCNCLEKKRFHGFSIKIFRTQRLVEGDNIEIVES